MYLTPFCFGTFYRSGSQGFLNRAPGIDSRKPAEATFGKPPEGPLAEKMAGLRYYSGRFDDASGWLAPVSASFLI